MFPHLAVVAVAKMILAAAGLSVRFTLIPQPLLPQGEGEKDGDVAFPSLKAKPH